MEEPKMTKDKTNIEEIIQAALCRVFAKGFSMSEQTRDDDMVIDVRSAVSEEQEGLKSEVQVACEKYLDEFVEVLNMTFMSEHAVKENKWTVSKVYDCLENFKKEQREKHE